MNIFKTIFNPTSRGKLWRSFILIIILCLFGTTVDIPNYYNKYIDIISDKINIDLPNIPETKYKLGLDLQGGTHLVYKADVSELAEDEKSEAVIGVRDVIERRVNVFGVSEPNVQMNQNSEGEYQVIAELAGVHDVNEAIKMIGETPLLEFKELKEEKRELTDQEKKILEDNKQQVNTKLENIKKDLEEEVDFNVLIQKYSDKSTEGTSSDAQWISKKDYPELAPRIVNLELGVVSEPILTQAGYEIVKLEDKRVKKDPFNDKVEKEVQAAHLLICYKHEGEKMCDNGMSEEEAEEANKDLEDSEKIICTRHNQSCESGYNKEEALARIQELKSEANLENFSELVKANSTEPGASERGGELGWFSRGMMVSNFEEAVFSQEINTISDVVETEFGYHLIYKQGERDLEEYKISSIFLKTMSERDILGPEKDWRNTELTGKNLKRSAVNFNPNSGIPEVVLEFDKEGAELFEQVTERNTGKQVAIFLDSQPISAPTVNEKISGGRAVISGSFNIQEAKELARYLNAGALPVPIELISQKTVGASLGHQAIIDSFQASILGLILVAIFMILVYRLSGLLAVFSLGIYGVLVLAVFKLFGVTLTLSGLAGFILSIGMAVDANVLIFERIREELKNGKNLNMAIEDGFRRAWPSIRDGNSSTLITSLILIQFSTSIVRGFAVTLILGVTISMFSAIVITKNFLMLTSGAWLEKRLWILGYKR